MTDPAIPRLTFGSSDDHNYIPEHLELRAGGPVQHPFIKAQDILDTRCDTCGDVPNTKGLSFWVYDNYTECTCLRCPLVACRGVYSNQLHTPKEQLQEWMGHISEHRWHDLR